MRRRDARSLQAGQGAHVPDDQDPEPESLQSRRMKNPYFPSEIPGNLTSRGEDCVITGRPPRVERSAGPFYDLLELAAKSTALTKCIGMAPMYS